MTTAEQNMEELAGALAQASGEKYTREEIEEALRRAMEAAANPDPEADASPDIEPEPEPEQEREPFDTSVLHDGYIFHGLYPPEAADFCNETQQYYIEEITTLPESEWKEDYSNRTFMLKKIPDPTPEELAARALAKAKAERAEMMRNLTVDVDGLTFDANETAQERMLRTSTALEDGTSVRWVLADNSVADISVATLKRALRLAVETQTAHWAEPYQEEK